jgi:hypothetical protein
MTAASGKIPHDVAAALEALISLLIRSGGFVDAILRQCARGKVVGASRSISALSTRAAALGNWGSRIRTTSCSCARHASAVA